MLEALRGAQKSGPYRLGGHCFGGLIAFEMARQLTAQNEEVELLAIVNTPAPLAPITPPAELGQARYIETIARACEEVSGKRVPLATGELDGLDDDAQLHALRQAMIAAELLPTEADVNYIRGLVSVFRANSRARYRAAHKLAVPIALFRASERHPLFDFSAAEDRYVAPSQSTLGWNRLSTRRVAVHPVPGNHLTMLNAPHIETLAQALQGCLAGGADDFCAWESD